MGRTEFRTCNDCERALVDKCTCSSRAKWRAPRSARVSMLEKRTTPQTLLEIASYEQLTCVEVGSIPVPPQTGHCSNQRVSPSIPTTLKPGPFSLRVIPSPRQATQSRKARHRSAKLDGLPASASLVRHSFISF